MAGNRSRTIVILFGSFALIAAVLGVLGGLGWHKYRTLVVASEQGPRPESPEIISIAPATQIIFRDRVTAIGTVRAARSITLKNEISGQVASISMKSGDIVEQGQPLVTLDRSVEEAELLSALAGQRMARSMMERTRRVAKANASSGNELDQAEADMAKADAEIARLKAIINKKSLIAPFRAKAGMLDTHPGQYLAEGTEITTLQGIDDHLLVDFMMPQSVADSVVVGQPVRLLVEPSPLQAEVIAVDAQADRSTRNVMARAKLFDPPGFLQPNDSVKVQVEYGEPRVGIGVPSEAVRRSPTGAFVFLAEPDQTGALRATVRRVVPGQTIGGSLIVYQGLTVDDPVIVDGSFKLREGLLVEARQSPPSIGESLGPDGLMQPLESTPKENSILVTPAK